ncbi:serine hydrolase domain-containing protein [Actinomyces oricola]
MSARQDRARPARGAVAPGLEGVRELFDSFLEADPDYSAQVAAYVGGRLVVDLWGGPHHDADTLTGIFSASKGVSALMLARLVKDGDLDLEERVSHYWPEFATHGKERVTVRQLLSHQAGVVGVPGARIGERYDSRNIAAALAAMRPVWRPGSAFGYHGTAIGPLMEELYRRVAGVELQEDYGRLRAALGADLYLGLPESEEPRFAPVLPPLPESTGSAESTGPTESTGGLAPAGPAPSTPQTPDNGVDQVPDSLDSVVFFGGGPMDPKGVIEPNLRHLRAAGVASIGAVGSARGLARVYAAAVTGVEDVNGSAPFLPGPLVEDLGVQQCWGVDRVLGVQAAYATVFQKPQPGRQWGSWRAIGHDGAAGALGMADPTYGLALGYVRRRMTTPGGLDPRATALSTRLRSLLDPVLPL